LAAVPLFTAFGDVAADVGRQGRVRSGFSLPVVGDPTPAPSSLHVVGREPQTLGHHIEWPDEVDWDEASELRVIASKRFSDRVGQSAVTDESARRELGRAVIMEVVQEATESRFAAQGSVWSAASQDMLAQAVFDLMFRLGRLQPLVDRRDVENIIAVGHDRVFLEMVGGQKIPGPPVAASDEELVQLLQDLASRADPPRVFSDANPDLHLNLDGARLAASAFVTHRPSLVIRLHRLVRISLDDLVGLGTVSPLLASFLAAAVKARLSIVVSGQQGDGKTTLLRALCAEIGPEEVLGTFETERELGLELLADEHPVVFSWEARPGSGERGPDGRPVNEFTLQDGLHASFRYALDRQIVGEVRGGEVAQMIMAMESGSGSVWEATVGGCIPDCWPLHPHIVHELAVVADQRRRAALAPTSDLLENWHRFVLPSFFDRMKQRLKQSCDDDHQPWPARGRITRYTGEAASELRLHAFKSDSKTSTHDKDVLPPGTESPGPH